MNSCAKASVLRHEVENRSAATAGVSIQFVNTNPDGLANLGLHPPLTLHCAQMVLAARAWSAAKPDQDTSSTAQMVPLASHAAPSQIRSFDWSDSDQRWSSAMIASRTFSLIISLLPDPRSLATCGPPAQVEAPAVVRT